MTNKEIRIGNYLKRNGIVIQADEQTFWDMKNNPEQYEPIKLTVEWLQRFGFDKVKEQYDYGYEHYHYENKYCWIYFVKLGFEFELVTAGGRFNLFETYTHVHQLQNLHFASTGHELTEQTKP